MENHQESRGIRRRCQTLCGRITRLANVQRTDRRYWYVMFFPKHNINMMLTSFVLGMCLGGHLAYRCALDPRVVSAICYFATDIHSATLGLGKKDDSLTRAKDIKGELVMIFGKLDNHVPPEGRDLIRKTLHEAGVTFSFYEPAWAQRECYWFSTFVS